MTPDAPPRRRIVVGCPVRRRHWILDTWDRHVRAAIAEVPGLELAGYQFVAGDDDQATIDVIRQWEHGRGEVIVRTVAEPARQDTRSWTLERLAHMVGLRNALLYDVRERHPDLFLSLDADMLLAPGALAELVETLDRFPDAWAVGGKAFMLGGGSDRTHPSFLVHTGRRGTGYTRGDSDLVIDAAVIMGIKLMRPAAYDVDYRYSQYGEDIGWSEAVNAAGGRLLWDGRTTSKHVTEYPWLYLPDPRCGY